MFGQKCCGTLARNYVTVDYTYFGQLGWLVHELTRKTLLQSSINTMFD